MLRLTIARDLLHTALSAVRRSADPRSTMPILAHVRLLPEAGVLRLDATDLNQTATIRVPAEIAEASAGGVMVCARHFADLLGKVPKGVTVGISWEGRPEIQGEKGHPDAHIVAWRKKHAPPLPPLLLRAGPATFQVPTLDARDFPRIPELPRALQPVDGPMLREMLERVLPTISTDETRYHLNGALLCVEGGDFLAVSTDGHCLTLVRRARAAHALPDLGKAQLLIPRRSVLEIIQLLKAAKDGPVSFGADRGHAFLVAAGLTLSVKLNDAQFPPYAQVVPRDHEREVVMERAKLLGALDQALLMASERTLGVSLGLNHGALRVRADNPDKGECGVAVIMPMRLYEGKGRTEWDESDPAVPPAAKSLPDLSPPAPPPAAPAPKVKPAAARPAKKAPAAPPAEAADKELCDLCTALAERPLTTRAACLTWLRQEAQRHKAAQETAPGALRLVYSAPKVPGLRQPAAARRMAKVPTGKGKGGKVASKGKVLVKAPARRRQAAADEWDW